MYFVLKYKYERGVVHMQKILDALYVAFSKILPEKLMLVLKQFFTVAFFTFVAVGVVNTLSTAIISTLLDMLVEASPVLSSSEIISALRLTFIIGYLLSMLISFFLNCRFTFHEKPTLAKLIRFPVSYFPNFIIQYITVWFFTSVIPIHPTISYLIAAVIGIPVTFVTMKIFVFRKKN